MAILTYTQQLEDVQAAIQAIETDGQAWTRDKRRLDRANLEALYKREEWLRRQVAREESGGILIQSAVPRG